MLCSRIPFVLFVLLLIMAPVVSACDLECVLVYIFFPMFIWLPVLISVIFFISVLVRSDVKNLLLLIHTFHFSETRARDWSL
jgi:hypothetical protein